MSALEILGANAVSATLLGAVAALASLRVRRPAVLHALWLAVLVDLLTPPLLAIRVLPAPAAGLSGASGILPVAASAASAALPATLPYLPALASAWCLGSLAVAGLALWRGTRLCAALEHDGAPHEGLARRLGELAPRAGVARAPRLRVVAARISPLVVPGLRGPVILFPCGLVRRLAPRELDAILLHELAHVRRGDPWIRLVELAASVVFFWHPVVFAARAALRRAEEQCCDAHVLRALPGHAVDYARALVKTIEFLSCVPRRVSVWTTGVAPVDSIERRLTMILDHEAPARLRPIARIGLLALLGVALAIFPSFRSRAAEDTTAPAPAASDRAAERADRAAEIERVKEQIALERAALERERETLARQLAEAGATRGLAVAAERADLEQLRDGAHALALELRERARAETLRAGELDRERMQADLERERGGASAAPGDRAERSARLNDELRREIEKLRRRVAELERRVSGAATID